MIKRLKISQRRLIHPSLMLTCILVLGLSGCASWRISGGAPQDIQQTALPSPSLTAAPPTETTQATEVANTPPDFPPEIYPDPLPDSGEGAYWMGRTCPNPAGLEAADELPAGTALDLLNEFTSGDPERMKRASDPAHWEVLESNPPSQEPVTAEMLMPPLPADKSPYADALALQCGQEAVDLSWWVQVCEGPCDAPNRSASLTRHFYLVRRGDSQRDQWLIWASE